MPKRSRIPLLSRALCALLFALPAFAASAAGIGNFHQVNDHLYRGAQPTDTGFRHLAEIGVKTVLDLRESDSRSAAEERLVHSLGMQYVNVPMSGLTPPTEAQIEKILAVLQDHSYGTVFVHCRRGADRTGAVIAAYRIEHDGWSNVQALQEAKADGMAFFQLPRKEYILKFHPASSPQVAVAAGAQ